VDKKLLFSIVFIALLIGSALVYVLISPAKHEGPGTNSANSEKQDRPAEGDDPDTGETTLSPGAYKEYDEDAVRTTSGTKLLFFHAPWCPQCREMESSITEDGLPAGVTVFKVDYDSNQALRQKYGVTLQTTFVKIDDQGGKIKSYVAYDEPRFSAVERELLR
jgi:thiol-disulfide isomerase/thioredoxin